MVSHARACPPARSAAASSAYAHSTRDEKVRLRITYMTAFVHVLASRLSVSGILGLCIEVDLGCRWVGKLQAEQPAALSHKRDGSRGVLFQGVAGSGLDQGSTPTPLTRSFVSQVKPAFLPLGSPSQGYWVCV